MSTPTAPRSDAELAALAALAQTWPLSAWARAWMELAEHTYRTTGALTLEQRAWVLTVTATGRPEGA